MLRLVSACAGLAVAAAGASGAAATPAPDPVKRVTFQDAMGEDPAAPDITSVVVSSTSTMISFRIEIPNRPTLTEDMRVTVWIDADDDPATMFTHRIDWDPRFHARGGAHLHTCTPTVCAGVAPSFRASYENGAVFSMLASELGEPARIRFRARADSDIAATPDGAPDFTNAHLDHAPGPDAWWTYALRPPRLVLRSFSTVPATPRAGATFSVHLSVSRPDTGSLRRGRVTCTATVGGVRLVPRAHGFVGGRATCVFALPASARGKLVRGSITVAYAGVRLTKTFSRRVGQ